MTIEKKPIYHVLVEAGCEIDHHESDLYVRATLEALKLTWGYPRAFFLSPKDGKAWIELPFSYLPFWEKKAEVSEAEHARQR